MRRLAGRVLPFLLSATFTAVPLPAMAAKDVRVARYDVEATLGPDGSLEVEERVEFVLTGGPFTRVHREIPRRFTDGIEVVRSSGDGVALEGEVLTQTPSSDALLVQWNFPPSSDRTRTWVLRYRLVGVMAREADADRLAWSPLPSRHDYRIDESHVTLRWPRDAGTAVEVATRRDEDVRVDVEQRPEVVRFVTSRLGRHDDYQIKLRFRRGGFAGGEPAWQRGEGIRAARASTNAFSGLGVFVVCVLGWSLYWWQHRPTWMPPPETPTFDAPSSLPPALAAALMTGRGRPPISSLWGTLMSLARQGVVRVEPSTDKTGAFRIRRTGTTRPAFEHERVLLEHVYGAVAATATRDADVTHASFEKAHRRFGDAVWSDLRHGGYVDDQRVSTRTVLWRGAGVMTVLGGLCTAVGGLMAATAGLDASALFVPLGLVAAAGVVALLAAALSPLSDRGLREGAQWKRVGPGPFGGHSVWPASGRHRLAGVAARSRRVRARRRVVELRRWPRRRCAVVVHDPRVGPGPRRLLAHLPRRDDRHLGRERICR